MTCRHAEDDPACSSYKGRVADARKFVAAHEARTGKKPKPRRVDATPDAERFEILQSEVVASHLVLKVQYPNCAKCSYEGVKVMVILDVSPSDALKWKRIDPHFRDKRPASVREAPSPVVRFHGSDAGWEEAVAYAKWKSHVDDEWLYCYLPGLNRGEFSALDEELRKRGAIADVAEYSGGRVYRVHRSSLNKLPSEDGVPYLGDDDSGHRLSRTGLYKDVGPWTRVAGSPGVPMA